MQGISIVKAYQESPCGTLVPYHPPKYIVIPSILEGRGVSILHPQMHYIMQAHDGLKSTLILKAFWGNDRNMVEQLVGNYFRDDDPNNLLNWLI